MAREQGISENEIIESIEACIIEGILPAKQEKNAEVLERWEQIPSKGAVPTALERIIFLGDQISPQ